MILLMNYWCIKRSEPAGPAGPAGPVRPLRPAGPVRPLDILVNFYTSILPTTTKFMIPLL